MATSLARGGQRAVRRPRQVALSRAWPVPVIPGVLAFITGGYRLSVPPLWGDEGITKAMAGRSVGEILATLPHDDAVHGAYYLVVHVVETVAGSSSTVVLRLPSVVAMAVAAAFTALIARRLAVLAGSPWPALTGLLAGGMFALLPAVIYYAQQARSYAIVTMLAAIATYLLLTAVCEGGRWWLAYAAAAALTGLFNIFGLLLLAAHGVTILIAGRGRRVAGVPARWLLSAAGAVAVLIPLAALAYTQRAALAWMTGPPPVGRYAADLAGWWAGSAELQWPVYGLAAVGAAAGAVAYRRSRPPLTPGSVALPWLVVPPAVLLAVSQADPIYDSRYVEFCLPALAILVASGLTSLACLARLAWVPSAAVLVLLVVLLIPADAKVRLPDSRPDNLTYDSQIVAANARPGDIVFFIPMSYRPVSDEFPAQWRELRDIALAQSPVASDTLYGTDVSPAELLRRFTHVTRVWVYSSSLASSYLSSAAATPVAREEALLVARMELVRQWRDGDKMLTLYQVRPAR